MSNTVFTSLVWCFFLVYGTIQCHVVENPMYLYFDKELVLKINTTRCRMLWLNSRTYKGKLQRKTFSDPETGAVEHYSVCVIRFSSSIYIGKKVTVKVSGQHGLSLVSHYGNIEIYAPINISGSASSPTAASSKMYGGYISRGADNFGPAKLSNCSSANLYGRDFKTLLGGSVCFKGGVDSPTGIGGGALELKATSGATISADGHATNSSLGAMGGTIRLVAKRIILQKNAFLTARGSSQTFPLAGGGVIQLNSDSDIVGICEDKFDVSGGKNGLANILVSAAKTFQVQYIQQGELEIDTTNAIWMHKTRSNASMAFSYEGKLEEKSLNNLKYKVSKFEFQTPILINGSVVVKVLGTNSLSLSSTEGIFIGVNIDVGHVKQGELKMTGGFCRFNSSSQDGGGPGRGKPNSNGGAGHGGKGGLLFEADNQMVYGGMYGVADDIHLIGGSSGSSKMEMETSCGGGAIKIYSKRNLTINAAIRANGVSLSPFNQYSIGGSSGGTIILESARHVILGENALLEAKGAHAQKADNDTAFEGGGGGGGVIAITFLKGFVGKKPSASENTKGGEGTVPGDNGVIVINGTKQYGFPPSVIEEEEYYHGCVNATEHTNKMPKISMKAHLASPGNCIKQCKDSKTWALIRLTECLCSNANFTSYMVHSNQCQSRCFQNSSLVCGGANAYSMYSTGYWLSSTIAISITPLTTAILPSKSSLVSTTASEAPTDTERFTTRSPTEPSDKFEELENVTLTEYNVNEVVEKLQNLTSEEQLNSGDTRVAIEILLQVANDESLFPRDKHTSQALGENILQVASSLLSEDNVKNWGVPTEEENGTATVVTSQAQVLEIVEKFGLQIGKQLGENESVVIESQNIAMGVETVALSDWDDEGVVYPRYNALGRAWSGNDRLVAHKELLDELAADNTTKTVVVYALYNGVSDHFPSTTTVTESSQTMIVNSRIIALKFNKNPKTPFTKPIRMWFDKLQTGENVTAPLCSFVDVTQNEGIWSGRGCHLVEKKALTVECACDHLTNFAILMQVKDFEISQAHFKALTVITYVGCGISLFGLALTLVTFLSLETLASERTSIHKNLVVAIGLAQIVFLAGIDATYNPIACKAVALFLHYLYTAAFTWMLCEGIHLYSKVVEVFSEGSKMKYYYVLGWGVPLTIVFISAAARWGGYGTERACWISIHQGLIWAFVVPVLIIMTINFVVMIMVIKVVITSVTSLQSPGNTSQVKAGVKGMIVLLPLLGLTWVFGLMAISKDTIVFQYLFAILNSLQGLFIFAFHCIGNSEVRVAYKRLHEKRTLARSLPEHSLSSSHHSKEKKRMDSHETNLTGEDEVVITKTIRSVSDVKLSGDNMAMQTLGPASPKTSLKTGKTRQDRSKTSEIAQNEEVSETIKETTSNIPQPASFHRKSKILSCHVV